MNMSAIRESAFQILFAQEIQQEFSEEQVDRYITENKIISVKTTIQHSDKT